MGKKIKNERYRSFLDNGLIDFVNESDIDTALENIKGRNVPGARALLICLYYTGGRPCEILSLKSRDITKEASYIKIRVPASKNGLPRTLFFRSKNKHTTELYKYAITIYDDLLLFLNFRSYYKRILPNGKERIEISDSLRYHFSKWFNGKITPYFLRHNRFSQLSSVGVRDKDIQFMKGAKTLASVEPYLHLSTDIAKKLAKKII